MKRVGEQETGRDLKPSLHDVQEFGGNLKRCGSDFEKAGCHLKRCWCGFTCSISEEQLIERGRSNCTRYMMSVWVAMGKCCCTSSTRLFEEPGEDILRNRI